jgi:DNA replication factor Dna2
MLKAKAALFGTMRHAVFEETMKVQKFTMDDAMVHIRDIILHNAEGLLSSNVSSREAEEEMLRFLPQLQNFANTYTDFGDDRDPCSSGRGRLAPLESHGTSVPTKFAARSVHAVEEPMISPELGLKGNVDMLVNALTADGDAKAIFKKSTASIMGVELKTGHNQTTQNAHVAQLALYVMLLQTLHSGKGTITPLPDSDVAESGLLLYMSNEAVRAVHVAPILSEIKSLIGMRNIAAIESARSLRPRGVRLAYEQDRNDSTKSTVK